MSPAKMAMKKALSLAVKKKSCNSIPLPLNQKIEKRKRDFIAKFS